jgi:hypothetical protein
MYLDRFSLDEMLNGIIMLLLRHEQRWQTHEFEYMVSDKKIGSLLEKMKQGMTRPDWALEILPSREEKEEEYHMTLEELQEALESTLECFDDLVERLNCFCTVQDKAEMLYEASSNLNLRNDPRKQIALYIKTAVLNVYSENLKRKNLEALLEAVSVANQPEPSDSDRRKVLHILYSGGLHAFPHLKGNLSEVITERKD